MDQSDAFAVEGVYLDTASIGVPPRVTIDALHAELDRWARGAARPADFDSYVQRARNAYAALVGVPASWVACGPQVSVFAGVVATDIPREGVVLVPEGEFTSVTFPLLAQGHRVREVPLAELADAIDSNTGMVAFAAVQSANGAPADVDAIAAAAERYGSRTFVDVTQAAGWLPIDGSRFDYTVCSAYKWLLSPRGTAFLTVREERLAGLTPLTANWYAGDNPWTSIYGLPLRLADDARRFDVSPAWHSWVGTAHSLEYLAALDPAERWSHSTGLAAEFRLRTGLQAADSAIVSLAVTSDAAQRLSAAGIAGSTRAGRLRLAFYLYNSLADVEAAVAAVEG